ncbi:hypothetical protein RRG08_058648 [Elysia crispata]|uniref:Uncharacterized protein n=1 Tax=Elysia crispata TaxID=231223 RepID=A0AAE1D8G9_9GAST|nr:hypothetical protein RRG08_058648 [Elysia crispata]
MRISFPPSLWGFMSGLGGSDGELSCRYDQLRFSGWWDGARAGSLVHPSIRGLELSFWIALDTVMIVDRSRRGRGGREAGNRLIEAPSPQTCHYRQFWIAWQRLE